MKYLRLMRIKHYLKNFLIFLPLIFSGQIFEQYKLERVSVGFLCFSFISSVVYIVNDIQDVEKDKKHDVKKHRPIASGDVSIRNASVLACILMVISILLNVVVASRLMWSWVCIISYFAINFYYSIMHFKNKPLVDVVLLVAGFAIRVYYGSVISGVRISSSFYLVIISGAFFMGFGKRRNEKISHKETRDVLALYSKSFLDKGMYSCMTLAIVFYSLWCVEKDVTVTNKIDYLWTVPIFMIIMLRYSMIIEGDSDGDPVDVIFSDKALIGLIVLMGVVLLLFLYL